MPAASPVCAGTPARDQGRASLPVLELQGFLGLLEISFQGDFPKQLSESNQAQPCGWEAVGCGVVRSGGVAAEWGYGGESGVRGWGSRVPSPRFSRDMMKPEGEGIDSRTNFGTTLKTGKEFSLSFGQKKISSKTVNLWEGAVETFSLFLTRFRSGKWLNCCNLPPSCSLLFKAKLERHIVRV